MRALTHSANAMSVHAHTCSATPVDHPTAPMYKGCSQYAVKTPQWREDVQLKIELNRIGMSGRPAMRPCLRSSLQEGCISASWPDPIPHPRPEQECCPFRLSVWYLHMQQVPVTTVKSTVKPHCVDPTFSLWKYKADSRPLPRPFCYVLTIILRHAGTGRSTIIQLHCQPEHLQLPDEQDRSQLPKQVADPHHVTGVPDGGKRQALVPLIISAHLIIQTTVRPL